MKLFKIAIGTYTVCWKTVCEGQFVMHHKQIVNHQVYEREEMILDPSIYQSLTLAHKQANTVLDIVEFVAKELQLSLDFVTLCIANKLTVFKRTGKNTNAIYLLTAPSNSVSMLI